MNTKTLLSLLLMHFFIVSASSQVNRYWVGSSIYRNSLTGYGDLSEWALTDDNGTGSWSNSGTGSAILKIDNAAGGAANKLIHVTGSSPKLLPLYAYDGVVELQILALSIGTRFSIEVEEYDAADGLVTTTEILPEQEHTGFYSIELGDYSFDAATTQIRFVISAKNSYFLQGTAELNFFNYFNSDNHWSNTTNWSAVSGGAGGASLPGISDNVIFDANSASNAIINVPVTINSITLASSYKSGVVNSGSNTFTSTGTAVFSGGFFVGENESMSLHHATLSGTQFLATSGNLKITNELIFVSGSFKPATGTVVFSSAAAQNVPALNYYNVTFEGAGVKTATGFNIAGNLINNTSFSSTGTVVFNGSLQQHVSGTGISRFTHVNLTNSSNTPTLLSAAVEVTGVLTFMANTKLATGGNLTLIATSPTVTGSIAAFPSGATLTGNVRVQKYIYSAQRIYRYLSSSVSGATVADWKTSIPITGTFADPSTGAGIVSASPSMFVYTESAPGLQNIGYAAYPGTGVSSSSAPLTAGKGYSLYVRNNTGRSTVLEVSGAINKGTILIPVTYTPSGFISEDGWNLVGNPYPSSINWSSVPASDRVNVGNAIYYQDNNLLSPVYRSWVNGVGTNCSSGVISVSQAFWVKATGASPVLRLRESNKTSATPSFYRVGEDAVSLLRISLDSSNSTFRDETVIRLADDATVDFDEDFDAYKLYDATHPAIGSSTKQSPLLSINALALSNSRADTLELFVKTIKQGNYALSVPEYTFDASLTAYLLDTYIDTKTQLTSGVVYPFSVSIDSAGKTDRFRIVLESNTTIPTALFGGSSKSGMVVFPNPASTTGNISIRYPQATNMPLDILIYDVTGMQVYSEKQIEGTNSTYSFTLPSTLRSGIYSIHSVYEGSSLSSTLIVK